MHNKKVCVFVDGENLRHSICELFPTFQNFEHLPKRAEWTNFFDWIARKAGGETAERVRTYWYVIKDIDFTPYDLDGTRKEPKKLERILCWHEANKNMLSVIKDLATKEAMIEKMIVELEEKRRIMQKRFSGWINLQNTISTKHTAIEFRRAGSIRYNLFEKRLGSEKAVDVHLAVDLVKLKDIYDIAVIVSGDQDYVPAVSAIKDFGKRVISVAFQQEDGKLLPGGARRLSQVTDSTIEVNHEKLKGFLKMP